MGSGWGKGPGLGTSRVVLEPHMTSFRVGASWALVLLICEMG